MISKRSSYPPLGAPPKDYSQGFMDGVVRTLSAVISDLSTAQQIKVIGINITSYPTNGGGLRPGDCWVDADGMLRVVRDWDAFSPSSKLESALGTVSVIVV
jgi:hypothetical protein